MMRRMLGVLAGAIALATAAQAETYPSRPITMIVPFAAGGNSDVIARIVADEMGRALNQRIINENVPGAGGTIALTRVARAAPDGYTIVIGNSGTNAAAYALYPDIKYTPDAFVPVGLVAKTSAILAVRKDFPADSLADLVAHAKRNPGRVSLGHAGVGSSNYIVCKTFAQAAAVEVVLVSYRGAGPALNDLIGGQVDGVCDAASSISAAVEGRQVKALAVAAPARLSNLPDLPTAAEAGLPEFQALGWNALFVPSGTPDPVIAALQGALRTVIGSEGTRKRMQELGVTPPSDEEIATEPARRLVLDDIDKLRKLLAGAQP
jgi:tripartite-type tricarboxylate transporter receptor subunit TctC